MQEEPDQQVGPQLAEHARDELEMIVLHPHDRAGLRDLRGRLGEALVDPLVRLPPAAVVDGLLDRVVVEGPEGGVGEAFVVLAHVVGAEGHRVHAHPVDGGQARCRTGATGPAHPGRGGVVEDGVQGADQAAWAASPLTGAIWRHRVVDGQAVGHHHEGSLPHSAPRFGGATIW
ncbi:hypothetical protein Psuf_012670 [Phytohabitans suffuscus]|uniref:Uncharacterized protein n=1 Tax=Phytohabitans suffuscus TaxID=624315 RepID=A0A6F8YCU4_9ACTN|nr:hypothetical protein Psuf_012670 [Phytohabitans suffuscus]